jgi:secreted trypsin-like serine protease
MRIAVVALLVLASYCEARPSIDFTARASFGSYIVNGVEATPGEFPWQLSQQRQGSTGLWSHSCGASLLSSNYALSAAHCVEGTAVTVLRVIAGLHDRTASDGVTSNVASYKTHERYNLAGEGTFGNDIAIITLSSPIAANGGKIQFATLPTNTEDLLFGSRCVISGWGRVDSTNVLPVNLQKAEINIISTDECNTLLSSVSGALATDRMVCLFESATQTGSCNGDSGGPLNCNYIIEDSPAVIVAGVTSWGISGGGACLQSYPSVYTRTSAYLDWIETNTP